MTDVLTRAELRAARISELDPTLAAVLERLLTTLPAEQHEPVRAATAIFCAWIERQGTEFEGYDDAFAKYEKTVDGTAAAGTLPYVQLLLVALDERGEAEGQGAHSVA